MKKLFHWLAILGLYCLLDDDASPGNAAPFPISGTAASGSSIIQQFDLDSSSIRGAPASPFAGLTLLEAQARCRSEKILLTFQGDLSDIATILDPFNYQVSGGMNVVSVELGVVPGTVCLFVSPALSSGFYSVAVSGIRTSAGETYSDAKEFQVECPDPCIEFSDVKLQSSTNGLKWLSFKFLNASGRPADFLYVAPESKSGAIASGIVKLKPPVETGAGGAVRIPVTDLPNPCANPLRFKVALLTGDLTECCAADLEVPCPSTCLDTLDFNLTSTGDGSWTLSVDVINLSTNSIHYLYLTSLDPCLTIPTGIARQSPPVAPNQMGRGTFRLNATPKCPTRICVRLSSLTQELSECCSINLCFEFPKAHRLTSMDAQIELHRYGDFLQLTWPGVGWTLQESESIETDWRDSDPNKHSSQHGGANKNGVTIPARDGRQRYFRLRRAINALTE